MPQTGAMRSSPRQRAGTAAPGPWFGGPGRTGSGRRAPARPRRRGVAREPDRGRPSKGASAALVTPVGAMLTSHRSNRG